MIRLRSDCLEFELSNGEKVPCSAQTVTVELLGGTVEFVDREIVENATAAVLHYFTHDLNRTSVTLSEFTNALEVALRGLGFDVTCDASRPVNRKSEADLRIIAHESGKAFELGFFARLRDELRRLLREGPNTLKFSGLRGCVKELAGARRWSPRCQQLNDQIVDYLRGCLIEERMERPCDLVVTQ